MQTFSLRRLIVGLVLAAICVVTGASIPITNQANGEVRGTAEAPTFQAGAVPVLREISATLRQMDTRLARLEAMGQKLQASAALKAARTEESN